MSRIGKMPIAIPAGVTVKIDQSVVSIKGPKGELTREFHPDMKITLEDSKLIVTRPDDERLHRALHGLTRTLLANMVQGVTKGFDKWLEIQGVGYRADKAGDKLSIRVGYTHPVEVVPMPGTALDVEGGTRIKVSGPDKEIVGLLAANIKAIRPPDAYKGKGIRYLGEYMKLKAGKAGKAVGKKE